MADAKGVGVRTMKFLDTFRFCLHFILPDSRSSLLVAVSCVLCITLAKVFHLVMGLFMKLAVDSLNSPDERVRYNGPMRAAVFFLVGRVAVALSTQGFEVAQEHYSQRTACRFSVHVFNRVMRQSVAFHEHRQVGETTEVVRRGVEALDVVLRQIVFWLLPTVIEICYVTIIFCKIGIPSIAVAVVVTVVIHVAYNASLTERRSLLARQQRDAENAAWAHTTERIAEHATVTAFGVVDSEIFRQKFLRERTQNATFIAKRVVTWMDVSSDLILQGGTFAGFVLAARSASAGTITAGDFALVVTYISALFYPLLVLARSYGDVVRSFANAEQVISLLRIPNMVEDPPQAISLPPAAPPQTPVLEFDRVSFAHARGAGLRDVGFRIDPGKCVAVVGPSGAGKSTLVRLLLRIYDVEKGHVAVNGVDVKSVHQTSLRLRVALVPQDSVLFNASVRDNVRYARPGASDAEIWAALTAASLDWLVKRMPDGLDTGLGERGVRLSGGERQRVGIARAILKDVNLFIFDEATSALSTLDEQKVLARIKHTLKGKASLIVAHRLSTVRHADEILVMERGSIVERGSHDQLLRKAGLYARMWEVQAGETSII